MFVRIDRETNIVLDKQEFGPDGSLISEIRLERIAYKPVPAIDFTLPKDYAVVRAQVLRESSHDTARLVRDAGFAARRPQPLPEGFSSVNGNIVNLHGVRTVRFLYSDGIRTLSLFESAAAVSPNLAPLHPQTMRIGNRDAQYAEEGDVALLSWNDGTLYYTLVGELGRADIQRLAAAINP